MSHYDKKTLGGIIRDLNHEFGTPSKDVTMIIDPIHDYLGITIDHSSLGVVNFTMYDFLEDILRDISRYGWNSSNTGMSKSFQH